MARVKNPPTCPPLSLDIVSIPLELLSHIASFILIQPRFRVFGLVCKRWHTACFRSVTRLRMLRVSAMLSQMPNLEDLSFVMRATNGRGSVAMTVELPPTLTSLSFDGIRERTNFELRPIPTSLMHLSVRPFDPVLPLLWASSTSLTSLKVTGDRSDDAPLEELISENPEAFPRLTSLTIAGEWSQINDITALLNAVQSQLTSLTVHTRHFQLELPPTPLPSLRSLNVWLYGDALAILSRYTHVTSLDLNCKINDGITHLLRPLKTVDITSGQLPFILPFAPSLADVRLDVSKPTPGIDRVWPLVTSLEIAAFLPADYVNSMLSQCTKLKTLTFHGRLGESPFPLPPASLSTAIESLSLWSDFDERIVQLARSYCERLPCLRVLEFDWLTMHKATAVQQAELTSLLDLLVQHGVSYVSILATYEMTKFMRELPHYKRDWIRINVDEDSRWY